jgi:hypothetical protein
LNWVLKKATYLNNFIRIFQEELRYNTAPEDKEDQEDYSSKEGIISRSLHRRRATGGDQLIPGDEDSAQYRIQ